jgi:hypothetical protein
MLDDQILNMKLDQDLPPIMKTISKILFKDVRKTCTKCV